MSTSTVLSASADLMNHTDREAKAQDRPLETFNVVPHLWSFTKVPKDEEMAKPSYGSLQEPWKKQQPSADVSDFASF
jgi:hypothetical protein